MTHPKKFYSSLFVNLDISYDIRTEVHWVALERFSFQWSAPINGIWMHACWSHKYTQAHDACVSCDVCPMCNVHAYCFIYFVDNNQHGRCVCVSMRVNGVVFFISMLFNFIINSLVCISIFLLFKFIWRKQQNMNDTIDYS